MTWSPEELVRIGETLSESGAKALRLRTAEDGWVEVELKPEPCLTVADVAKHLLISEASVRRLVKDRKLTTFRTADKTGDLRFEPRQLRRDISRFTQRAYGSI